MKPDVQTYQVEWEFDQLWTAVHDTVDGGSVLEVGCYEGGTLWHWLQIADTVVAVDDQCRNVQTWREWVDEADVELIVLWGDSQEKEIVESARARGPFDLVFIDGDHTYDAVRADVDNYGAMVGDGGVLVLHDILPRPGYGVSQVWSELKSIKGVRYMEIAKNETEPGNEGPCGIGVLWT